jgi:anti-sigma regulatory factor (Ser/Thr protein kinase)
MARLLAVCPGEALMSALHVHLTGHEIEVSDGDVEAIQRIRDRAFDVVITDPRTRVPEDLAFAAEARRARPGIRMIVLAPDASHEDVINSLRANVFACFTPPFECAEIAVMAKSALAADAGERGIEVVSSLPHWMTLRVSCHLLTAERLVRFMTEHESTLPEADRDMLMVAFREMLVNAMEHGAGFDPEKVIEVTAARTARAIVYHFRDPGAGFTPAAMKRTTEDSTPEAVIATALHRAEMGLRPGGFGMLIARQIADELVFNERGNEVLLIKHLS